jgi:hypothetical protein
MFTPLLVSRPRELDRLHDARAVPPRLEHEHAAAHLGASSRERRHEQRCGSHETRADRHDGREARERSEVGERADRDGDAHERPAEQEARARKGRELPRDRRGPRCELSREQVLRLTASSEHEVLGERVRVVLRVEAAERRDERVRLRCERRSGLAAQSLEGALVGLDELRELAARGEALGRRERGLEECFLVRGAVPRELHPLCERRELVLRGAQVAVLLHATRVVRDLRVAHASLEARDLAARVTAEHSLAHVTQHVVLDAHADATPARLGPLEAIGSDVETRLDVSTMPGSSRPALARRPDRRPRRARPCPSQCEVRCM